MTRIWGLFLIISLMAGIACSDPGNENESSPDTQTDGVSGTETASNDIKEEVDLNPDYIKGDFCLNSSECPGQWCDKHKQGCVECYLTAHCPDEKVCFNGECVDEEPCSDDTDCDNGICVDESKCGECHTDDDCKGTFVCMDHVCRPPAVPCDEDAQCYTFGAICDEEEGECVDCIDDSQCGIMGEFCDEGTCTTLNCIPGEQSCIDNDIQICRTDGTGSYLIPCEEGLKCLNGSCVELQCEPGTTECLHHEVLECTAEGIPIIKGCFPGQECINGDCQPMRQRVLVIFDTSGSMNRDAVEDEYPNYCSDNNDGNCLEAWPACEPEDAPFTVAGISKKVFTQFFKSEDTQQVHFALQRFPQRTNKSAPVCEGGYYTGDVVVTGDTNAHTLPLGVKTWFDDYLHEIILVDFPPPDASSNLLSLIQWFDFKEDLFPTDKHCNTSDSCDQGVCLGPIGNKKCHIFTNPEIRPHGWTPLGRSLFYAGEFVRRNVVVDGKPCAVDEDCQSAGYYCNELNKCYDPLKDCRLTVVVLFTDGGETEFPWTNDFFNPAVQAKRLRYGLGCATKEDCSPLPFCRPKELELNCASDADCLLDNYECNLTVGRCQHKTEIECFENYCKIEGGKNYCTNDIIEAVGAPVITFQDTDYGQNRLLDANGNPINLIVNVVDASVTVTEGVSDNTLTNNYQIALHGGGLHVVVAIDDEADFLAKLKGTIDPKSLYEQCTLTP